MSSKVYANHEMVAAAREQFRRFTHDPLYTNYEAWAKALEAALEVYERDREKQAREAA